MDIALIEELDHSKNLLLVDDEESILQALKRMLRRDGYTIYLANSGEAGLAILEKAPIGVIVSDQRMPFMTGSEFLGKVKEKYPDTIRIVLSGYTELNSIADAINTGAIYKFLTKPWDDDLLRAHIAEAFTRYDLKSDNKRLATINKAMIDSIPDALLLVDTQTKRILTANTATGILLGSDMDSIMGRPITDLEPIPIDPHYWDELSSARFRPLHGVETNYQCGDGPMIAVRITTAEATNDQLKCVLVLAHDVRQEKMMVSHLERLNAELAAVLEATSEGLLVLDMNKSPVRINHRLKQIFGIPEELCRTNNGLDILRHIFSESTTPEDTLAEFLAHFSAPESPDSGIFHKNTGETIRWYANPQMLKGAAIGHVLGFTATMTPQLWTS